MGWQLKGSLPAVIANDGDACAIEARLFDGADSLFVGLHLVDVDVESGLDGGAGIQSG